MYCLLFENSNDLFLMKRIKKSEVLLFSKMMSGISTF